MTIAGMVLVNNPGTSPVYWPLDHAEWHGLTPTDWIFPFFLFIVGTAIPMALGRYRSEPGAVATGSPRTSPYSKIFTRSVSIYLLGAAISVLPFFQFTTSDAPEPLKLLVWLLWAAALLFLLLRNLRVAGILAACAMFGIAGLNLAGYNIVGYDFSTMRIMGVLQRIAVCYLAASLIYLHTNWRQQIYIAVALLLGYWVLMTTVPVPGCEVTTIDDKACNLAAYLDRLILTENHIWRFGKVYDPEGLLSTIPAIATTISGILLGTWLKSVPPAIAGGELSPQRRGDAETEQGAARSDGRIEKAASIFFTGTVLLALGLIWNGYFPMNKSLWTSSYVLATSGLALLVFGCCYWLVDIKGYSRWSWPFRVFGANALALFVFSGIFARMISAFKVAYTAEGKGISAQKWVVDNVFLQLFQPINASLAFAITFILFWLFLMWLLYRKGIYVKV
jgi:predicted acyltransferase